MVKIATIVISIAYMVLNVIVSKQWSAKEMRVKFIQGQNIVGAIATNVFYAPAWVLKAVKFLAVTFIK